MVIKQNQNVNGPRGGQTCEIIGNFCNKKVHGLNLGLHLLILFSAKSKARKSKDYLDNLIFVLSPDMNT